MFSTAAVIVPLIIRRPQRPDSCGVRDAISAELAPVSLPMNRHSKLEVPLALEVPAAAGWAAGHCWGIWNEEDDAVGIAGEATSGDRLGAHRYGG